MTITFLPLMPGRRGPTAVLALALATACSSEVTRQTPVVDAVAPAYACRVQQTTDVAITGSHFAPLAFGLPDSPQAELPTVRLERESELDGKSAGAAETLTFDGRPGGENALRLEWESPERMLFTLAPELARGATQGPAPRGLYTVAVEDPVSGRGEMKTALGLVDAPAVEIAAPGIVCLAEGPRTLTLTGTELLYIGDAAPAVGIGEPAGDTGDGSGAHPVGPLDVTAPTGCTDIPHGNSPARFCTGGEIVLSAEAIEPGLHPLALTNPAPADCVTETPRRLRVVPPPVIEVANPPVACPTETPRTITLTGRDLLRIDGAVPTVTVTDAAGEVQAVEVTALGGECAALETEGHAVERCTELTIVLPAMPVAAAYRPTLTVLNPEPAGCAVATTTTLTLVPPPSLASVVPPGVCDAQGDRTLVLEGADFLRIEGVTPAATVDGVDTPVEDMGACEAVDVTGLTVERCTNLTVRLPAGTSPAEAGAWAVPPIAVTNPDPAGCGAGLDGGLVVFPPPTLALAEPPLLCLAQGARTVRLTGAGLVTWDGATPAIDVGGAPATVDAATSCVAAPVRGAVAEVCTTLDVTLAEGALDPGIHAVTATAPEPVGCESDAMLSLRVVPPPALAAANPPVVCAAEGPREVVLSGTDLLRVGELLPTVTLRDADGVETDLEVRGLAGTCETLETEGLTVERCTELTVVIPAQNPATPYQPTLTVLNPAPAGCTAASAEILTLVPAPVLAAVTPSSSCTEQDVRPAVVTGSGLLRIDGLVPAFTVDGAAVTVTSLDACTPVPAAGMAVETCTSATIELPTPGPAIDADFVQPLVAVTNPAPAGCGAVAPPDALTLTPAPTALAVDPPVVCLAQGERTLTLTGTGLLSVDGTLPEAFAGDVALGVEAPAACTALPVSGHLTEACGAVTLRFAQDALPAGAAALRLTNPQPAGCETREALSLQVLAAPTISAVEPGVTCPAEGDREVVLSGTGFVRVDGVLPAVRLADAVDPGAPEVEVPATAIDDCVDVAVEGHVVAQCTRLTIRVPQRAVADELSPVVRVTNPAPVGCDAAGEGLLHLVGPPVLDDAGPVVVCQAGAQATLAVTGRGFIVHEGAPPAVQVAGQPAAGVRAAGCAPLAPGFERCDRLEVDVDPAVAAAGTVTIRVENPAQVGCSDEVVRGIAILAPPQVDSAEPSLLCTEDGARDLTLHGRNFVELEGVRPTVTVGDATYPATSVDDCTAAMAGPLAYRNCNRVTVSVPAGALAEGTPRITVTGPAPAACSGGADGRLTVPPPLAIVSVTPDRICSAAGERNLVVRGAGFLVVDGQGPTVDLGGRTFAGQPRECAALPTDGHVVQVCSALGVTVPQDGVPPGATPVGVTNPAPAGCGERVEGLFTVVPMPRVDAAEPDEVCADGVHVLRITGAGFIPESLVTLGPWPAVEVQYIDENTVVATFPENLDPGTYPLTVDNGDGCVNTLQDAVEVHPMPIVFFVDPPVVYNGITLQVTVYTSGLDAAPREVRVFGPDGTDLVLVSSVQPGRPNKVLATLPAGLAPGEWSVQVTSRIGCVGALPGGFTVTNRLTLALGEIDPGYVSPSETTAVTLRTREPVPVGQGLFVSTPRAYLNPHGAAPDVLATAVRALVFVDERTLTGVVLAGLTPGAYDVVVVNPDATVGVLSEGLHVTADEPPVITGIEPASLDGNGPQTVRIQGRDFDAAGASLSMTCRDPVTGQLTTAAADVQAGGSDSEVVGILPADQFATGAVCTVTLTNGDGASFRFSAVSIKTPAQNLADWTRLGLMVEARRAPGLVAGRPTFSSRYLYAIGGDGGAAATAKRSVEAATVDTFGDLGAFAQQRNVLPAPRTLAGSARVGRFVYVLGGNDGAGIVDTVYRAEILDPLAAPEITDISLALLDARAGLPAGLWHYRVSAVFPADDASNPGGESLPGEVLVADLPEVDGLELRMEWSPVPGAAGYRVYRTSAPGESLDDLELLGTTAGDTFFVDHGDATDPAGTPLSAGATGVWHEVGRLTTPREAAAVVAAPGPPADPPGTWYLYAFGGRSAANTYLSSWEFARIIVGDGGAQAVGAFGPGTGALSSARAEGRAFLVGSADISNIARGHTWLFVGPGRTQGGFTRDVEAAEVPAGGDLGGFITTDRVSNDFAGYGGGGANGYLFIVGGRGGDASDNGISGEICRSANDPGCGVAPAEPPDIRNWNALGSRMSEARVFPGSTQESAFFFMAGGSNGATATHTVDRTVQ